MPWGQNLKTEQNRSKTLRMVHILKNLKKVIEKSNVCLTLRPVGLSFASRGLREIGKYALPSDRSVVIVY